MSRGIVICLCDLTGIMAKPWVDAGYEAILIDPQHQPGVHVEGLITRVGHVIDHPVTWQIIRKAIVTGRVVMCFGFPPCTDVAVSGAAHFEAKRKKDFHFQAKAALVAEQCRVIGELSGAPWGFENPVSVFSSIFGGPTHTFSPNEYGGYLPENDIHPEFPKYIAPRDAYPKKTCLWTGGGFVMPKAKKVEVSAGYSTQYSQLGGKSERTKNIRSATPRGFSMAVMLSNAPHINPHPAK